MVYVILFHFPPEYSKQRCIFWLEREGYDWKHFLVFYDGGKILTDKK